jgi:hypothetical protein
MKSRPTRSRMIWSASVASTAISSSCTALAERGLKTVSYLAADAAIRQELELRVVGIGERLPALDDGRQRAGRPAIRFLAGLGLAYPQANPAGRAHLEVDDVVRALNTQELSVIRLEDVKASGYRLACWKEIPLAVSAPPTPMAVRPLAENRATVSAVPDMDT